MIVENKYVNTKATRRAMFAHINGVKAIMPDLTIEKAFSLFESLYELPMNESQRRTQRAMHYKLSKEYREAFRQLRFILQEESFESVLLKQHLIQDFFFFKNAMDSIFSNQDNTLQARRKFAYIYQLEGADLEFLYHEKIVMRGHLELESAGVEVN